MSGCPHILLSSIHLFNAGRWMEKISQIRLSWSRSLYLVLLYRVAQAAMLDKIIYGWEEMNQMKEVLGEVR